MSSFSRKSCYLVPGPPHWGTPVSHQDVITTAVMQAPMFSSRAKCRVHSLPVLQPVPRVTAAQPGLRPKCVSAPHVRPQASMPCELHLQSWRGEVFLSPRTVLLLSSNLLCRTTFNINTNSLQEMITCSSSCRPGYI